MRTAEHLQGCAISAWSWPEDSFASGLQKLAFGVWAAVCTAVTLHSLSISGDDQYEVFHIYYQPLLVLISMQWLWFINVRYFELRNIRYDLCFSNKDQKYLLSSRQIFQVGKALHQLRAEISTAGACLQMYSFNLLLAACPGHYLPIQPWSACFTCIGASSVQ